MLFELHRSAHVSRAPSMQGAQKWRRRPALTDGGDDEDDEEGVAHGQERVGEGGEDLGHRPQLAEDAQHAAAAQQQDQAEREADGREADDREGHDDEVEQAPSVGDEGAPPVGVEVEEQLGRECDDEDEIERVENRLLVG